MAGAEAVRTGAPAALALSSTDLAERVANRERQRLGHLALGWDLPEKLVAHLVLCVTLQGGCDADSGMRLVEEERRAAGFAETAPAEDIVNDLAEALPDATANGIDAIRPDLIGEAFVLQGMNEYRRFPTRQTAIVERAWCRARGKVIASLVHTAQDFAHGKAVHPAIAWLGHLLGKTTDLHAAVEFAGNLPDRTLALRELAALASERIVRALGKPAASDLKMWPLLAAALLNLARRREQLGQDEPALAAAERAVALYDELAAQEGSSFRRPLASALNRLGILLGNLGRDVEALAVTEKSVALLRDLDRQNPKASSEWLAVSLDNLGSWLGKLGRREESLQVRQEALRLSRELAEQDPESFRPDLAMSLSNIAYTLGELAQYKLALTAAQEAVALRTELAAQRPDAYRPELAASLHNLANILRGSGRPSDALPVVEKAVAIRRELTSQRPDAFQPVLALSLALYADCLNLLNRVDEAMASNIEAITSLSRFFRRRPTVHAYWMRLMIRQHTYLSKRLGKSPNMALLKPLVERLQSQPS
jgi:hypothetical protein